MGCVLEANRYLLSDGLAWLGAFVQMAKKKSASMTVQNIPVSILRLDKEDFICITDMAKARTDAARAADVIKNWLRNRTTLEFLGTWERMYNPAFIKEQLSDSY
jgi:hypothetical protein